jgi:hypothetical protein
MLEQRTLEDTAGVVTWLIRNPNGGNSSKITFSNTRDEDSVKMFREILERWFMTGQNRLDISPSGNITLYILGFHWHEERLVGGSANRCASIFRLVALYSVCTNNQYSL